MYQNKSGFLSSIPPVTKNIIIINVLLLLATSVAERFGIDLNRYLGLHFFASGNFNPVQLITYMFMHGSFSHLFFNMFAVFMFGSTLEYVWGKKRYLIYYFITGIGAALIQ
ncbi:MAG: rhomboid family intramembrane serine protease, partial [Candidatus Azobacteroides sp.]|nr:rhomboid family intramembrane serine protease [Candidatus Azobacteroides sp.]